MAHIPRMPPNVQLPVGVPQSHLSFDCRWKISAETKPCRKRSAGSRTVVRVPTQDSFVHLPRRPMTGFLGRISILLSYN